MVKMESSLEIKRVFKAPVDQIFQAWTNLEMMDKWLFPDARMHAICQVDLRIGGSYEVRRYSGDCDSHTEGWIGTFEQL